MDSQHFQDSTFTFEIMVLKTTEKMRDADSQNKTAECFTYFKWMMWLLKNHINQEDKDAIEYDMELILRKIAEVESKPDSEVNSQAKEVKINIMKQVFINTHMSYVMAAFPRAGITQVADEGKITFDTIDFETMKRIVRTNSGLIGQAKRVMNDKDIDKLSDKEDIVIGTEDDLK